MRQASSQPRVLNLIAHISRLFVRVIMRNHLVLLLPASWVAVDSLVADSFSLEEIPDVAFRDFACVLTSSNNFELSWDLSQSS